MLLALDEGPLLDARCAFERFRRLIFPRPAWSVLYNPVLGALVVASSSSEAVLFALGSVRSLVVVPLSSSPSLDLRLALMHVDEPPVLTPSLAWRACPRDGSLLTLEERYGVPPRLEVAVYVVFTFSSPLVHYCCL